jgi:hypothetical protein
VLSVYGNKQHEQPAVNKVDIRPEIIKAKAEEQKAQDRIERKDDGMQMAVDGSQALFNVVNVGRKPAQ